jgi:hypothetical protein
MSALGHKQTFWGVAFDVRFTPESGHYSALHQMSANSQKRTLWFVLWNVRFVPKAEVDE